MAHVARSAALASAIILAVLLAGCGGGSGGVSTDPGLEYPGEVVVDAVVPLKEHGMIVQLQTEKNIYAPGEEVHVQLFVTNTSSTAHTLNLGKTQVDGWQSFYECDMYSGINDHRIWTEHGLGLRDIVVPPGQKAQLVDTVWDQKNTMDDTPVSSGQYYFRLYLPSVRMDGQPLSIVRNGKQIRALFCSMYDNFEIQ